MFINRSKNKSGTVSVHVLQKRDRNNVLVKSFGSSRDEKEIERMVEQARIYIQQQAGTFYHLFNQVSERSIDLIEHFFYHFPSFNIVRIRCRRFSCVLSTLAFREGIKRSLYFAFVMRNFILSRFPEISTPARKGKGDFRIEI